MNFGEDAPVRCELNSRLVDGAMLTPKAVQIISGGQLTSQPWDGQASVNVPRDGAAVLVWDARR